MSNICFARANTRPAWQRPARKPRSFQATPRALVSSLVCDCITDPRLCTWSSCSVGLLGELRSNTVQRSTVISAGPGREGLRKLLGDIRESSVQRTRFVGSMSGRNRNTEKAVLNTVKTALLACCMSLALRCFRPNLAWPCVAGPLSTWLHALSSVPQLPRRVSVRAPALLGPGILPKAWQATPSYSRMAAEEDRRRTPPEERAPEERDDGSESRCRRGGRDWRMSRRGNWVCKACTARTQQEA